MKQILFFILPGLLAAACNLATKTSPKMESSVKSVAMADVAVPDSAHVEVATLGGGCFWCMEAVFQELKGVLKVESGFSGGHVANPTYREVCSGLTGHAEVAEITFDPAVISYKEVLEVFFTVHDPTTLNRQGADAGTQYRSAIFYHSEAQRQTAEEVKKEAQEIWGSPIVTEITPFDAFYKAENYHQNYYQDNPDQPYCTVVIAPKVKKFREKFRDKLKQ